jgi:hypothetical protein
LLRSNAQLRCSSVLRYMKAVGFHLQKERHDGAESDLRNIGRDRWELIHHWRMVERILLKSVMAEEFGTLP